jgi:hypothetical protein
LTHSYRRAKEIFEDEPRWKVGFCALWNAYWLMEFDLQFSLLSFFLLYSLQ